jgi:hypothetical protein
MRGSRLAAGTLRMFLFVNLTPNCSVLLSQSRICNPTDLRRSVSKDSRRPRLLLCADLRFRLLRLSPSALPVRLCGDFLQSLFRLTLLVTSA